MGEIGVYKNRKRAEYYQDRFMRLTVEDVPGIYAIINTEIGRKYVGQSKHLETRRKDHWTQLIRGCHCNHHLQQDFDNFGKDVFIFVVLELVSIKRLDEREQYWINRLHATYNQIKDIEFAKALFAPVITEYIPLGEKYQRPAWHAWVYGGARNPYLFGDRK